MDLTKLSTEPTHFDDSVECVLYDATGQPEVDSTGQTVAVFVVSEYSTPARKNLQKQKQQISKLLRRYGSADAIPQSESDALDDTRTAACLASWRGFEADGAALPFSPENALAIVAGLRTHKPKTLAQIEGAIAAHASFFPTPSVS